MENKPIDRLLVMITNPFAAMNVIHSGVLAQLSRHFEIQILTNLIESKDLHLINDQFGLNLKAAQMELPRESRFLNMIRKLEKALFFEHFEIQTERIRELNSRGSWPLFYKRPLRWLRRTKIDLALLKWIRKLIIKISKNPDFGEDVSLNQFAAVLSTSPLDIRENIIVNRSKDKIPSVAMIINWDNLTSTGVINADHDLVLVWNKIMANEYVHFYKLFKTSATIVKPVGIPRFDTHFATEADDQNAQLFRKQFNVSDNDRIILFATSASNHFPSQHEILKHLLYYAEQFENVKILIRVHAFDDVNHYDSFKNHPNIRFSVPSNLTAGDIPGIPAPDTLLSLSRILKNVKACVHTASTMQLDAAACEVPVISIAYDGDGEMPYAHSVRRFYDYTHQKDTNHKDWGTMVYSCEQLYRTLNKILNQHQPDSITDREFVKTLTFFDQPRSVETITKSIIECVG